MEDALARFEADDFAGKEDFEVAAILNFPLTFSVICDNER